MRPAIVRAAPLALLAVLVGWTAIDLIRTAPPTGWVLGGALLALAGAAALQGTRRSQAAWHRASRAVLAIAFIGERLFAAVGLAIGLLILVAWLALSPSIPTRKHA